MSDKTRLKSGNTLVSQTSASQKVFDLTGLETREPTLAESANVVRLKALGIPVMIGQKAENLEDVQVVVISSAIKPGNPESENLQQIVENLLTQPDLLKRMRHTFSSSGSESSCRKVASRVLTYLNEDRYRKKRYRVEDRRQARRNQGRYKGKVSQGRGN